MLRLTIDVCPPEGERKTIESLDVERCDDFVVNGYAAYRVTRRVGGGRRDELIVSHRVSDGARVLAIQVLKAIERERGR